MLSIFEVRQSKVDTKMGISKKLHLRGKHEIINWRKEEEGVREEVKERRRRSKKNFSKEKKKNLRRRRRTGRGSKMERKQEASRKYEMTIAALLRMKRIGRDEL